MASIDPPHRPRHDDNRETDLLQHIFSLPNLDDLRGQPDKILAAIDDFSTNNKHLMNIGPHKGQLIVSLIAERKPSTVIELGGYVGYSAIKFGDAVRRAGGKRYLSLEINPVYAAVANMLVDLAGLRDIVRILVAPSHLSLARLVRDNAIDHVELLFLDHWKDRYLPDLWLVEQLGLLKPGVSVLAADNVLKPGAPEYLDWVRSSPAEKREKLKQQNTVDLGGIDLAKAIKEKGEKNTGVDLENVPGNPNLVYETEIHIFERRDGSKDGVEITKVVGEEKN
ncbi:hypothetical protein VTN77DRAFT_1530 [Rasamsonia byssochlamydoides]|uniref:uncharacterized protein n=1 Tax=Rasamsonia byssochlamydoides TaxID=89139 RepID=UPI003742C46C